MGRRQDESIEIKKARLVKSHLAKMDKKLREMDERRKRMLIDMQMILLEELEDIENQRPCKDCGK